MKKRKKEKGRFYQFGVLSLISVCLMGMSPALYASEVLEMEIEAVDQNKVSFTGRIVDGSGDALIGASILEENTTNGTLTNIDGEFNMSVGKGSYVVISYIGFKSSRLQINSDSRQTITLKEEYSALDEVVVVGYGIQKKVNLTGSVSSIDSDEIATKPVVSLKDALAGMAPGMTVTKASGQPGASNPTIRIRGVGTWGDSSPLVIVDGMAMSIGDVMPNDVETISVLKDAASAAIYGSRAANGVILITTKQGKKGKLNFSYSTTAGFQKATRKPKMAKSWQYAELFNQAYANDGKGDYSDFFPQDKIDRMRQGGDPDVLEGSTDWFDEILETAPQYTHDVAINGGSDKITYAASLGWAKQDGVIKSSYERFNTRLNTTALLTDWLKVTSNLAYINDISKYSAAGPTSAYYYAPRALPYMPVKFSDGTWSFHSTPRNPVRMTTDEYGYERYKMDKLTALISPELTFFDNTLTIKGVLGYEKKVAYIDKFSKTVTYDGFEPAGQVENVYVPRNEKSDTWHRNSNLTLSATINYANKFGKHDVAGLVGASRERFSYNNTGASRKDFPNNDFEVINPGDPSTSHASGNKTYEGLVSVFGRINYGYDDRYLFEANLRHDGSSKFLSGNRWGTFPSFSGAWRVSEEKFFESAKHYVQNLKVRGSWGKLGNQSIANYQGMSTYASGSPYIFGDGIIEGGFYEAVMGNPDITWETSTNFNIGLDVNFLDNRLGFEFDWYKRKTKDILLQLEAPAVLGMSPAYSNAGVVQNKGWEISVNWEDHINDDFSYNVGVSLSDVKNKIIDLKGYKSPSGNLQTRLEGLPLDALYGWETLGIAHSQELVDKYKPSMNNYNPNFGLGDIIIKDQQAEGEDGYGVIDANDKKMIGNPIPRLTYDINLGFKYKNFEFSALFQGVGMVDGFLGRDVIEPLGPMSALSNHYKNSFDPANPSAGRWFPKMSQESRLNYANFSHWVQDASYLRLKNLYLGYTFKFPNTKHIKSLTLSASGQNLFTLTGFKIFDPETGINSISFPNVAVYTFGLNVKF